MMTWPPSVQLQPVLMLAPLLLASLPLAFSRRPQPVMASSKAACLSHQHLCLCVCSSLVSITAALTQPATSQHAIF